LGGQSYLPAGHLPAARHVAVTGIFMILEDFGTPWRPGSSKIF